MPLKTTQVEELPGLNLTSMIDVVFLLLIFFMVATNFSQSQTADWRQADRERGRTVHVAHAR